MEVVVRIDVFVLYVRCLFGWLVRFCCVLGLKVSSNCASCLCQRNCANVSVEVQIALLGKVCDELVLEEVICSV